MGKLTGNVSRSVCWTCAKACGGCCWSVDYRPVDGWDARYDVNRDGVESFAIYFCPEYEEDTEENRNRDLDYGGCMRLAERMLQMTREDYIRATDRMQDEMDRFFRGKGAAKIHRISEPDVVIRFLRNEAAEYRKRRDKTRIARKRR